MTTSVRATRRRVTQFLVAGGTALVTIALTASAGAAAVTTLKPGGGANGRVQALTRLGGVIYAGGTFTTAKDAPGKPGVPRQNIAAYNASTGAVQPFNPGEPSQVRALANDGASKIFVGGDFGLRAYSTNGTKLTFPNPGGKVYALTVSGNWLYVGGSFSVTVAGKARTNAVRINIGAAAYDSVWKSNAAATVKGIDVTDNGSFAFMVGQFKGVNGTPVVNLAKVSTTDGKVQSFRFTPPPPDPKGRRSTRAVETYSNKVVVAWTDGVNKTEVYDINSAATLVSWGADGDVQAMRVIGGDLYLAGHWIDHQGPQHVQRYDAYGASSLQPENHYAQPNSPAQGGFAIVDDGHGGVWFGGDTTSVYNTSVTHLFHLVP